MKFLELVQWAIHMSPAGLEWETSPMGPNLSFLHKWEELWKQAGEVMLALISKLWGWDITLTFFSRYFMIQTIEIVLFYSQSPAHLETPFFPCWISQGHSFPPIPPVPTWECRGWGWDKRPLGEGVSGSFWRSFLMEVSWLSPFQPLFRDQKKKIVSVFKDVRGVLAC